MDGILNFNLYFRYIGYNFWNPKKPKTAMKMASAYISNCNYKVSTNRLQVLKDLMDYGVTIDSFGKCLNNAKEPNLDDGKDGFTRKLENMGRYKFHLAFENSKADGYITEKYWQSIVSGTVPVY